MLTDLYNQACILSIECFQLSFLFMNPCCQKMTGLNKKHFQVSSDSITVYICTQLLKVTNSKRTSCSYNYFTLCVNIAHKLVAIDITSEHGKTK